jgi:hypothetical protein
LKKQRLGRVQLISNQDSTSFINWLYPLPREMQQANLPK